MNVAQSPMRPSAERQHRQVIAPPNPPRIPPSAPAPGPAAARSPGGGNGILRTKHARFHSALKLLASKLTVDRTSSHSGMDNDLEGRVEHGHHRR